MVPDKSKRAEHTQLVLSMADRQGLDLQELILRAEFTDDQLEQAVDRCVGCTRPNACKSLLATFEPIPNIPDYCRNGDTFDALRSL
jgi:NADPH-dependent glutamate synthase beta subunit-like oxidoreductase